MPSNEPESLYLETLLTRLLESRLGYVLSPWPRALWLVVETLAEQGQMDAGALLRTLTRNPRDPRIGEVVAAATIPHTSFYRHADQFDRLRERLIEHARATSNPLKIWSAGCATGEEAFSIALVAEEVGAAVEVLATDISAQAVAKASRGRYERGPLRRGGELEPWTAPMSVRSKIHFAVSSLVGPNPALGRGPFDLIFCRNVLIYFDPTMVNRVQKTLASHLRSEGDLIFSPVESVLRVPQGFTREEPLGWFRRLGRKPTSRTGSVIGRSEASTSRPPPQAQPHTATTLSDSQAPYEARPRSHPPAAESPEASNEEAPRDADATALEAAAQLLQGGNPEKAEARLRELLESDATVPEGWFLLGESLLARGERRQATVAFRQAAAHAGGASGVVEAATLASAALRRAQELEEG